MTVCSCEEFQCARFSLLLAHSNVLGEKQVSDLSKKIVIRIHEYVIHDMSLGQIFACPDSFMLLITPWGIYYLILENNRFKRQKLININ